LKKVIFLGGNAAKIETLGFFFIFYSLMVSCSDSKHRNIWKLWDRLPWGSYNVLPSFKWKSWEEENFVSLYL